MEHTKSSAPLIAFKGRNVRFSKLCPVSKKCLLFTLTTPTTTEIKAAIKAPGREEDRWRFIGEKRAGTYSILRPLFAVGSLHCARRGSYLDRSSVPSSLCPHPNPQTILRVALPRQLSPQKILDSRATVICLDVCRRGLTLWEEK